MSRIQILCCDFCGGEHVNGNCTIKFEGLEVQYPNFQKNNTYSNTYNPGWKDHQNFKWSHNQALNSNQGIPHVP